MKRGTFEYIEQTLLDYSRLDEYIEKRVEELKYPTHDHDENIGGGKSNVTSDPTGRLAVTIADDKLIYNLKRTKKIVSEVLDELEPAARKIVDLYYIQKPRKYTWDGVAEQTGYSVSQCSRIRDAVFEKIAEELGLPI